MTRVARWGAKRFGGMKASRRGLYHAKPACERVGQVLRCSGIGGLARSIPSA